MSIFIPYYCSICNTILPQYGIDSLVSLCSRCAHSNKIGSRIVAEVHYGSTEKDIQPVECHALYDLPTTQRVDKECPSCHFGVAALIMNADYKCQYVCLKCATHII